MRYSALLLLILITLPCCGQTPPLGKAETTGPCSPAVSGNNNQFTMNCKGIDKEQGQKMLAILNKILANQLDPAAVTAKLDEILKVINPAKPDLAFVIVNPEAPWLILWPLHSTALSVKADPLLWDIDREDGSTASLFVNEAKYDWIRPDQHGGPTALLHPDDLRNVVKPGHRIVGYITIACPNCERTLVCWVYFIYGQKGWFMDVSSRGGPNPARLAESIPALRAGDPGQFLASFPEWANRIPIFPKP